MSELVLTAVRDHLEQVAMTLPLDGASAASDVRTELLGQLNDYVLPRLAAIDAPLLVVLGGSTGSGKSTITNSVVESHVSLAGVVRPSTRTPVLVCRPEDRAWFMTGGVLPGLPRSTGDRPSGTGVHLVTSERLPEGLALLDAPDIDSVEVANHELAAQLLGAADAWLFVTTAARYADAVPWEYLRRARERSVALSIVVNRMPAGAVDEIVTHLSEMLDEQGMPDVPLFPIEEIAELPEGRLPPAGVGDIRSWLDGLVHDDHTREQNVRRTIDGVVRSIPARAGVIVDALRTQEAAIDALRDISRSEYDEALSALDHELGSGTLLRGEVLDRWREHVGTSAFMERLQSGVGRLRNRLRALVTGSPVDVEAARDQLESNLATLVHNHADRAALATVTKWEVASAGAAVLADADRGIDRPTAGLRARLDRELAEWQDQVFQLVRDQSGNKLAVARILSLGLNGIGVAVMIAVFSQTGGVTGAEAGVAAGTAAVTQTLLAAVFGDSALRDLVKTARDDLQLRLAGVFEVERRRFDDLLATATSSAQRLELEASVAALGAASS